MTVHLVLAIYDHGLDNVSSRYVRDTMPSPDSFAGLINIQH
jgi:hypothetical protein